MFRAGLAVSSILMLAGGLVLFQPAPAAAQAFALAPHISFVRGDVASDSPTARFMGGSLRIKASQRIILDGSADFRTYTSADGTQRVRERPYQATLLMFPFRSTLSPYVLGGIGIYQQYFDTLGTNGLTTGTTTSHTVGWHAGVGAELLFAHHVGAFADYRWRNVKLGNQPSSPGTPIIPGVNALKVSHQGSMWTGGLAFYF